MPGAFVRLRARPACREIRCGGICRIRRLRGDTNCVLRDDEIPITPTLIDDYLQVLALAGSWPHLPR